MISRTALPSCSSHSPLYLLQSITSVFSFLCSLLELTFVDLKSSTVMVLVGCCIVPSWPGKCSRPRQNSCHEIKLLVLFGFLVIRMVNGDALNLLVRVVGPGHAWPPRFCWTGIICPFQIWTNFPTHFGVLDGFKWKAFNESTPCRFAALPDTRTNPIIIFLIFNRVISSWFQLSLL